VRRSVHELLVHASGNAHARPGGRLVRLLYQVCRKAISANFTAFLAQLLAAYPAAPVVAVVCDNVVIHRSKIVQRWLASHPRILVLHGARYSPHDNPVERIWAALKAWLANSPTLTLQGRVRQVHAFFHRRTPHRCWPPPHPLAHRGYPRVTCRTSGRPLIGERLFTVCSPLGRRLRAR
jgi:transposase